MVCRRSWLAKWWACSRSDVDGKQAGKGSAVGWMQASWCHMALVHTAYTPPAQKAAQPATYNPF